MRNVKSKDEDPWCGPNILKWEIYKIRKIGKHDPTNYSRFGDIAPVREKGCLNFLSIHSIISPIYLVSGAEHESLIEQRSRLLSRWSCKSFARNPI